MFHIMGSYKSIFILFISIILLGCGQSIESDVEDIPVSFFKITSTNGNTLIKILKNSKLIKKYDIKVDKPDMAGGNSFITVRIPMIINNKFTPYISQNFGEDANLAVLLNITFMGLRRQDKWDPESYYISIGGAKKGKTSKFVNIDREIGNNNESRYIMDCIANDKEINLKDIMQ